MATVTANTPLQFRIILDEKMVDVLEDEPGVPIPFQKRDRIPRTPTSGSPTRRESLIATIEVDEPSITASESIVRSRSTNLDIESTSTPSQAGDTQQSVQQDSEQDSGAQQGGWCVRKWCIVQ